MQKKEVIICVFFEKQAKHVCGIKVIVSERILWMQLCLQDTVNIFRK